MEAVHDGDVLEAVDFESWLKEQAMYVIIVIIIDWLSILLLNEKNRKLIFIL